MIHFVLRVCELHDIFVTIVVLLFITNQHQVVIDFQLSLIGGVGSQLIQILRTLIGPTHFEVR